MIRALAWLVNRLIVKYCVWEDQTCGDRNDALDAQWPFHALPPAELVDGVWRQPEPKP